MGQPAFEGGTFSVPERVEHDAGIKGLVVGLPCSFAMAKLFLCAKLTHGLVPAHKDYFFVIRVDFGTGSIHAGWSLLSLRRGLSTTVLLAEESSHRFFQHADPVPDGRGALCRLPQVSRHLANAQPCRGSRLQLLLLARGLEPGGPVIDSSADAAVPKLR